MSQLAMHEEAAGVEARLRGRRVRVATVHRPRTASDDNTGWCVWPASAVLLRFLADGRALARVLNCSTIVDDAAFARLRVLELSAGAGLVAAAAAAAGALVVATETDSQLPQLRANAEPYGAKCERLYWGDAEAEAKALAALDDRSGNKDSLLVLACDLVFIALRDGREAELSSTLRRLSAKSQVVLVWEERRIADEDAFVQALGQPAADGAPALLVAELADGPFASVLDLPKEERIVGGGGSGEGELGALFYSPPPVRMVLLTAAQQN